MGTQSTWAGSFVPAPLNERTPDEVPTDSAFSFAPPRPDATVADYTKAQSSAAHATRGPTGKPIVAMAHQGPERLLHCAPSAPSHQVPIGKPTVSPQRNHVGVGTQAMSQQWVAHTPPVARGVPLAQPLAPPQ